MKKSRFNVFNLVGIIFFIVGTVFLIAGTVVLISDISFKNNAEQTQGEIINIERERYRRNGDNHINHYVTVGYTVDGEYYEREFSQYNSGMYVGKEITVYYNPDEPGDARISSAALPVVFISVGGSMFVIGAVFIITKIVSANRIKSLRAYGEALTGTITNITVNTSVRVNGRNPYKAECEVTDPYSGDRYLYSSKNIMEDISGLIGSSVTVYTDKNDRSKYYVDIDGLINNKKGENIHDYR